MFRCPCPPCCRGRGTLKIAEGMWGCRRDLTAGWEPPPSTAPAASPQLPRASFSSSLESSLGLLDVIMSVHHWVDPPLFRNSAWRHGMRFRLWSRASVVSSAIAPLVFSVMARSFCLATSPFAGSETFPDSCSVTPRFFSKDCCLTALASRFGSAPIWWQTSPRFAWSSAGSVDRSRAARSSHRCQTSGSRINCK